MPSKKKPVLELSAIPKELIDQFITGSPRAGAVQLMSTAFKEALIGRAFGAELY